MKVINGKDLFNSMVGLHTSMTKLRELADAKMHITIRYLGREFEAHDEPDIAIQRLQLWIGTFGEGGEQPFKPRMISE